MHEELSQVAQEALDDIAGIAGVDYADVRVAREEREQIKLHNRRVEQLIRTSSSGVGVRVLSGGGWGFAALPVVDGAAARKAARQATEIARGVAAVQSMPIRLAEEEPQVGIYQTAVEVDPFTVPLERKLADLEAGQEAMRSGAPDAIKSVIASMRWQRTNKAFASSEGSRTQQTLVSGGAGLKLIAADDNGSVQRSWPMDLEGGLYAAGYEVIDELALALNGARLRQEILELLTAPPCPAGKTTLILDTPQLALQIHESCGHPTESDRAMGDEISLAGASFMKPEKLGRLRYGSPIVSIFADSTTNRGLGTFGWDDEGVPARRTPLVSQGLFVGYLSSRETAMALGLGRSAGCMRAESWNRPPIIRMINVSLEPDPNGPSSLDELISNTEDGVLMTQNSSWSIDDLRLNFQFGCEAAWQIKKGKLVRMLRNPIYTGSTPHFWSSCNAIGNHDAWRIWGIASCGKGDPMQMVGVAHGCSPARFRGIEVGSSS